MYPETWFRLAFVAILIPMMIIRLRWHRRAEVTRPGVMMRKEGKWMAPVRWIFFPATMILLMFWLAAPDVMPGLILPIPAELRWVGLPMGLLGLVLLHRVHEALRENFSPELRIREHHQLVTSGPYAKVRHPMYTSFLLLVGSMALLSAHVVVWIMLFGMAYAVILKRLPREEQMMVDRFGLEYEAYRSRTGLLLPPWPA